jgi:hypothetical protein
MTAGKGGPPGRERSRGDGGGSPKSPREALGEALQHGAAKGDERSRSAD